MEESSPILPDDAMESARLLHVRLGVLDMPRVSQSCQVWFAHVRVLSKNNGVRSGPSQLSLHDHLDMWSALRSFAQKSARSLFLRRI